MIYKYFPLVVWFGGQQGGNILTENNSQRFLFAFVLGFDYYLVLLVFCV